MNIFANPIIKKFKEDLLLDKNVINSKGSQYSNYSNSSYVNFSVISNNNFQMGINKEREKRQFKIKVKINKKLD